MTRCTIIVRYPQHGAALLRGRFDRLESLAKLKILVVHNAYQPRGEDIVVEPGAALLCSRGHIVTEYHRDNRQLTAMGRASSRCASLLLRGAQALPSSLTQCGPQIRALTEYQSLWDTHSQSHPPEGTDSNVYR